MQRHIFVSYAHEDRHFVDGLVESLRSEALQVWIDVERGAGPIPKGIEEAMGAARFVVFVISHAASESDWVEAEQSLACDLVQNGTLKENGIIFLRVDDVAHDRRHLRARQYPILDAEDPATAARRVIEAMRGRPAAEQPPLTQQTHEGGYPQPRDEDRDTSVPRRSVATVLVALLLGMGLGLAVGYGVAPRGSETVNATGGRFLLEKQKPDTIAGVRMGVEIVALDALKFGEDERERLQVHADYYPADLMTPQGFAWDRGLLSQTTTPNASFERIDDILGLLDLMVDERKDVFTWAESADTEPLYVRLRKLSREVQLWVFPKRQRSAACLALSGLAPGSSVKIELGDDAKAYYPPDAIDYLREVGHLAPALAPVPASGKLKVCAVMGDIIDMTRHDRQRVPVEVQQVINVPSVRAPQDSCVLRVLEG